MMMDSVKSLRERYMNILRSNISNDNSARELIRIEKSLNNSCDDGEMAKVEEALEIILPSDFKEICFFYKGSAVYCHDLFNFESDEIIQNTLAYRTSINLPKHIVALGEGGDAGMTLLDTSNGQVLYISTEDVYNICEGRPLEYDPAIFPNFTDFFEYLLTHEEIDRGLKKPAEIERYSKIFNIPNLAEMIWGN